MSISKYLHNHTRVINWGQSRSYFKDVKFNYKLLRMNDWMALSMSLLYPRSKVVKAVMTSYPEDLCIDCYKFEKNCDKIKEGCCEWLVGRLNSANETRFFDLSLLSGMPVTCHAKTAPK